ncbi:MAG: peptidoglycan DD-metalloendopeptidase family protein [Chloroflexi bacterium]|nr:peptidoglycan DD-metalloendopeptidase family protein [Chloroflexota bacterium]
MKPHRILVLLLLTLLLLPVTPVRAQEETPDLPVYLVQPGDTLTTIALRFNLYAADLLAANPQVNPNALSVGQPVIIPGLEGLSGTLVTRPVGLGETLAGISRRTRASQARLAQLNYLTSPAQAYLGKELILTEPDASRAYTFVRPLRRGQSLLEAAVLAEANPYHLAGENELAAAWQALPGDELYARPPGGGEAIGLDSPLPVDIQVDALPLVQGQTAVLRLQLDEPGEAGGSLNGYALHFFPDEQGGYVALQGIHAMAEPGLAPLVISGRYQDGTPFGFEQWLPLQAAGYAHETLQVPPETIDPASTGPENEQMAALVAPITSQRYWDGVFAVPGYDPDWITSWFGTRRRYNEDTTVYFHTGLDYGGGVGLPFTAPAPGVVVFADFLTVRGGTTVIDHGWGVYSAFFHQSEIQVQVGDTVETGQQIGLVGGTGRVTGAHLHWEVWVNGVQVDPLSWLERAYP